MNFNSRLTKFNYLLFYSFFIIWSFQCGTAVQSRSGLPYNASIFTSIYHFLAMNKFDFEFVFLVPTIKLKHKICPTMSRDFFLLKCIFTASKDCPITNPYFSFFLQLEALQLILHYCTTGRINPDKSLVPIITLLSYTLLTHPCYCSFLQCCFWPIISCYQNKWTG